MPREPRDLAAGIFHVYTHCVWPAPALYRDDIDRMTFVRFLARTTATIGWTCIAMCLMGTHYHLIVEVDDGELATGMHRLNLAYARHFNKRHHQRGHVQFNRYGSDRIRSDGHLLDRYAYVALNPVRAGICRRAEDWAWSGYADAVGLATRFGFVDASRVLVGADPQVDLRRYVNGCAEYS